MSYFCFEKDIIKKYKIDLSSSNIICINGGRNIGKTTSVFNYLFNGIVNINSKILIIRNSGEQIKNAKADFNSRLNGRYMVAGSLIYEVVVKKTKDDEVIYGRGDHVGYIGSISQFHNLKSMEAKDVNWVLFDEYAECDVLNIYDKFISMLKTFERFNKINVIMLGNRETLNNEWMNKWGVLPNTHDFQNDRYVQFSARGHFIELGSRNFEDLQNDKTLANELATFDAKSNAYLNMDGYKHDVTLKVKSFKEFKIKSYLYGIAMEEIPFALMILEDDSYLLAENATAINYIMENGYQMIAIDNLSYTLDYTVFASIEAKGKIIRLLVHLMKAGKLYFDSFNGLIYLKNLASLEKYYAVYNTRNGRKR